MALQKAKIIVISSDKSNDEKTIPVMFNPNEYKISKNVNYNTTNIQGKKSKKIRSFAIISPLIPVLLSTLTSPQQKSNGSLTTFPA